jgi:phosphatidylglycerol---prolipoprotein diacylglyceryl transferase
MWPHRLFTLKLWGLNWRVDAYALLMVAAFIAGVAVALFWWKGKSRERVVLFPITVIAGFVGYWVSSLSRSLLEMTSLSTERGTHSIGWIVGAFLGIAVFARLSRIRLLRILDWISPSLLIGSAVGRVGCLAAGCCGGFRCDAWYCIAMPAIDSSHRYFPVQLISATWDLGCFFFAMVVVRPRLRHAGSLAFACLFLYSIGRVLIDGLRAQPAIILGLNGTQLTYAILVTILLIVSLSATRRIPFEGSLCENLRAAEHKSEESA